MGPPSSSPRRSGPHPDPPPDLHQRELPLHAASGPWARIHRCAYVAIYFGTSGNHRFDAPGGEYGVLYAAADAYGAFIETLGQARGLASRVAVSAVDLERTCYSRLETSRPLWLVDLTGPGLARLGADGRLETKIRAPPKPATARLSGGSLAGSRELDLDIVRIASHQYRDSREVSYLSMLDIVIHEDRYCTVELALLPTLKLK
jgi:RES domain